MTSGHKNLHKYGFNTNNKVYIIAEIGLNHGGDIEVAKKMIDSAVRAGVDAVKFQTYITEKRVEKDSPVFDIIKKCELPFEAFKELQEYSKNTGVDFFSTPFDEESVDYLESIDTGMYKVASFDAVNQKLLKKVADTGKPVVLSVGMADINEISQAYEILLKGTDKITLLHCVSAYPTKEEDANLAAIYMLKDSFDCLIGQSDHTSDIKVPLYAVAAGAQVIEKHYKIDEAMDCVDAPVSITEEQMKYFVKQVRNLENIMGKGTLGISKAEVGTVPYRRKI
ncbi:MAG: N-acetylneuraminate synthase [bacterium]|nr:N-acetylneuraminate synthase [bacterium]